MKKVTFMFWKSKVHDHCCEKMGLHVLIILFRSGSQTLLQTIQIQTKCKSASTHSPDHWRKIVLLTKLKNFF